MDRIPDLGRILKNTREDLDLTQLKVMELTGINHKTLSGYVQVAKRALNIGLDAGLEGDFVGAKALTREEACLYAFNTMKADMVRYNQKSTIAVGDLVITQNSECAAFLEAGCNGIWDTGAKGTTTQFAEKYFKKLDVNTNDVDAFGRPAATWTYDKDTVGTYALTPDFVFVNELDEDVLEDLDAAKYVVPTAKNKIVYNGATSTQNLDWYLVDGGANGFTIEMYDYIDDDKTIDKIVIIEEYFAQVGKFTAANEKSGRAAKVELTVFEYADPAGQKVVYEDNKKVDTDSYDKLSAFEKDDYVAVVLKADDWNTVLSVSAVEAVEGKLTKVTEKTAVCTSTVVMDGVTYELNNECMNVVKYGTAAAAGHEGTLYLDAQGCVIGWVSDSSATAVANLVYVAKIFDSTDKYGTKSYFAQVVHTDGEIEEIEVTKAMFDAKSTYELNVVSYTVPSGETANTLELSLDVVDIEADEIKTTSAKVDSYYFVDGVVFVYVNKDGAKLSVSVKEGVQKVTAPAGSFAVLNDDDDVAVVFIRAAASAVDAEDLVFVADASAVGTALDADGKKQDTYAFYINGEKMIEIVDDTTTVTTGFKAYSVSGETYKFEGVGTADGAYTGKTITISKDKYVNTSGISGLVDATVTGGIYDLTTNECESLAELADLGATSITASFIYDDVNNVITSMYITAITMPSAE